MRIGRHMPTHSKMVKAAEIAQQIGCEAIQIFASNPTGWRTPTIAQEDCAAFATAAQRCGLDPVVLHAPYLINLGTLDTTIWEKSAHLLSWTLSKGKLLDARYVVFHTGSHRGAGVEAGLDAIVRGVVRVLEGTPPEVTLLLENDVGAGNALGNRFEYLAIVLDALPEYSARLGVCLDTAHLWGAGYDIASPAGSVQVLQQFDDIVGLARLKVIHLNDTKRELGSHRDSHSRLGEGIIKAEGLHALLSDPRLDHVAVLLETPIKTDESDKEDWEHDAKQIAQAKSLTGRPESVL